MTIEDVSRSSVWNLSPVKESQTITRVSYEPLATVVPSGENVALQTGPVCSLIVTSSSPVSASHTRHDESSAAVTIRPLSLENDSDQIVVPTNETPTFLGVAFGVQNYTCSSSNTYTYALVPAP